MSGVQGSYVVIDLSHYNEVTSFLEIQQSGIVGVLHKTTEGTNWSDANYASRKPQALAAGLCGAVDRDTFNGSVARLARLWSVHPW